MSRIFHVEGYFEGDIEADSQEEAEDNFTESDIDNLDIRSVWAVDEEYIAWEQHESEGKDE